ncbi:MAG: ATP-dependent DNA helicase [Pseudomonadota bacterium]
MAQNLKLGIRELAEFCCRSGDLGYDDGPAVSAQDGVQIHQKLQKLYRKEAQSEFSVKIALEIDDYLIELNGRIDLLFDQESPVRIEEIKTVHGHSPNELEDPVHWGQLKCYGACYLNHSGEDQIRLSLNRVNRFSLREKRSSELFTRQALQTFLETLLRQYLQWFSLVADQRNETRRQANVLKFPFDQFREQQHRFAACVFRSIREKQQLVVEAPTGSGKTISTLFPSVKAIGEDLCDQIVYLSAKVSGQQQAVKAVELMDVDLSYVVIQAKARSCPCNYDASEIDEDGRCLRCIGFYNRLPKAREKLFKNRRNDVHQLREIATEFQVCPFELSLQMLAWSDIVICDFNYVFDPLVQLSYFRSGDRRKVLLVDELHNLVDRARGMYSGSLIRQQIKQATQADNSREIKQSLESMLDALDRALLSQPEDERIESSYPESLFNASRRFSESLGFDVFSNKHIATETLEFSKSNFRFQAISELFSEHHRSIGYRPLRQRELKLLCLNAFEYLRECYPLFQAVCGFSATLSPPAYFQQALGFDDECQRLRLDTSFPADNLRVCIGDYVDTRYQHRENAIDAICDSIAITCQAKPGNYLVFFSAYHFMQQVEERFSQLYPEIEINLQKRDFDEVAQKQFLHSFFEKEEQLGFAIMGGRFAEGIDYLGDALIGAIVVGVGLPQANSEQKLIQDDFNSMGLNGFDFAFRYPGLTRVLQSSGRVIRSETDQGVIVLLDRRFRQYQYQQLLPAYWELHNCNSTETLKQSLKAFWMEDNGANQN